MDINSRIRFDKDDMVLSVENILRKVEMFISNRADRMMIGEGFAQKVEKWSREIRRRKEDPFTLVVIGDFKRGKSTLINALLKEETVTTDVTTETVTMNKIRYGANGNEMLLTDKRRVRLANDELRRERLEEVMESADAPVAYLELTRDNELLKKITIIDTPGLQDSQKDFSELVKDSLLQADGVIYVFNIRYPISRTEQLFLKSAVLPQSFTSLLLVGNFADTMANEKEYGRVKEMIKGRIAGFLPKSDIYMLSALDECEKLFGMEEGEEMTPLSDFLGKQFGQFREDLDALIAQKEDAVLADRMQRLTLAMADDLGKELSAIEKGLELDEAAGEKLMFDLEEQKAASMKQQAERKEKMHQKVMDMKREATIWMSDFLERIIRESKNIKNCSVEEIQKYYEFYCIDLLQEALDTCLDYHREQLFEEMDETLAEVSKELSYAFTDTGKYSFRFHLDNRIWTKGDTVGFAISMVSNFGFLGTVAQIVADGVSGMIRDKEKAAHATDFVDQISSKLSGLSVSVQKTVDSLYNSLAEKAEVLLADSFAQELGENERLVKEAVVASKRKTEEKEALRELVEQVKEVLEEAGKEVAA